MEAPYLVITPEHYATISEKDTMNEDARASLSPDSYYSQASITGGLHILNMHLLVCF